MYDLPSPVRLPSLANGSSGTCRDAKRRGETTRASVLVRTVLAAVLAPACSSAGAAAPAGEESAALSGVGNSEADACLAQGAPTGCGDPCGEGVLISSHVTVNTVWDCPVYTLASPVFVASAGTEPTRLVIAPGTVVRGRRGDLAQGRLPGALIVTRSGRLEARGTRTEPIVFTSASRPGQRAAGDWGGVVLLGRAPTNVPGNFQNSGNAPGEMFIEGLPRSEETTYGQRVEASAGGDAGSAAPALADADHDCGTLQFVRIEFAGFDVGDNNELNGLTLGGCGRGTVLDYVQVHLGSDDGIELFGGTTDLRHAVITGAKDDSLDWDQGWRGRVQFLAIQQHHDEPGAADQSDNGFEGDGLADPDVASGAASAPIMYNVTLLASQSSTRAVRLREGTELVLHNAIIASAAGGAAEGLIELSDSLTADQLTSQRSRVNHTVLQGPWPLTAQLDSAGNAYLEADYFTSGAGSDGNTVLSRTQMERLLPGGFAPEAPRWVPARGSYASRDWTVPMDVSDLPPFFDPDASYRGAFDPSGEDWTQGWTAYPPN